MLDLLRSLEWAGGSDADGWCPTCGGAGRHEPDCRLDRAIRGLASEPTVDEMAREMGLDRDHGGFYGRMVNGEVVEAYAPKDIPPLYREHKARQIDATLAGKRVGPWLTPPAPKVYEASGPPTDPSALAAWLYARIGPGVWAEWVVRGNPRPSKEAVTGCDLDDGAVWLDLATSGRARIPGEPSDRLHVVHLLNPDGTVLWEAK